MAAHLVGSLVRRQLIVAAVVKLLYKVFQADGKQAGAGCNARF
jgi:hypothetical protein